MYIIRKTVQKNSGILYYMKSIEEFIKKSASKLIEKINIKDYENKI